MKGRRVTLIATGLLLLSSILAVRLLADESGSSCFAPMLAGRPGNALPVTMGARPAAAPPSEAPAPFALSAADRPILAVLRLRIAYEQCLLDVYARLLTADFQFVFGDPILRERYPEGFSRDDEIASARHLFQAVMSAPGPFRLSVHRIEVRLDALQTMADPRHPGDPARYQMVVAPRVQLRVRQSTGAWMETPVARHEFHVVRGDAAALPPGAPADSNHWYVYEWIEIEDTTRSVSGPLVLVLDAAKRDSSRPAPADSARLATRAADLNKPIPFAILRHPNPAAPPIAIELSLPVGPPARLDLVDVAGRVIARRDVRDFVPGRHRVDLSDPRLPPGVYWLRLTQGNRWFVSRLVVL